MIVERDTYGPYHVRGASEEGYGTWDIQVWLKGSDQGGPEDHRYTVASGEIIGYHAQPEEKQAVLALINQWEERLPLMVASPI